MTKNSVSNTLLSRMPVGTSPSILTNNNKTKKTEVQKELWLITHAIFFNGSLFSPPNRSKLPEVLEGRLDEEEVETKGIM